MTAHRNRVAGGNRVRGHRSLLTGTRNAAAGFGLCRAGAAAWLLSFAACTANPPASQPSQEQDPAETRPNVVVILTDTVRADRVSAYGSQRVTTPFFDQFARQGFLLVNMYAPCSWTRPSVASLFTGVYPQRHGVQMRQDALPHSAVTLAGSLGKAGWHTYILNTNPHVTETWGMTRGFAATKHLMPHPDQFKAGNGANTVLRHLRQMAPSLPEPFFLYVHLIDPHWPYDPPPRDLLALGITPDKADSLARYDGELHYTDRHIKAMVGVLESEGYLDNALVVLTSDHGDEFLDHGSTGHGKTLYQEVVKIPTAIRLSPNLDHGLGRASCSRIRNNLSLVDLMPTILELTGQPVPPRIDGRSLVPLMRCQSQPDTRPVYFSVEKEKRSLAAVLVGNSKLLVNRASGSRRLFFLDENPKELPIPVGKRPGVQELKNHLGDLLESFEWSVQPGLHIEVAGVDGQKDRRQMILRLSTSGKFTKVKSHSFEPRDHFVLSTDHKTLRMDSWLTAFWHRSPKHVWVQDRDELHVELDPSDASVTLFVELNGEPAPVPHLRFPSVPKENGWPVTLTAAQLTNSETFVDRRIPGVYIFSQGRVAPQQVAQASQEINAALRALGYIQ